jgi:hypothetical protein
LLPLGRVTLAGNIALRLVVHAAFRGLGLFSIRHDSSPIIPTFGRRLNKTTLVVAMRFPKNL